MQPKLERQLTSNFDDFSKLITEEEDDMDVSAGEEGDENLQAKNELRQTLPSNVGKTELRFLTGVATDIGGGSENQDKAMLFYAGEGDRHLVMGVFDGHGRELGELAAIIARDYMREELQKQEVIDALEKKPKQVFEKLFLESHLLIKDRFYQKFSSSGWDVTETSEGYLTKRMKTGSTRATTVTNVHGGTTATVVVILNGWRMLVANVGDSTALFTTANENGEVTVQELSAEHSPENEEEFNRVRSELPSSEDSRYPKLRFVYDVFDRYPNQTPKYKCPKIFEVAKDNSIAKQSGGVYYKNVRSEWATLVTTPPQARFQDALAFTRSLGDLHLHVYGVSHVPEVREFDLNEMHKSKSRPGCSVLFVCTDGVWDNWKYEDIAAKTLDEEFVRPALEASDAQDLTDKLMEANIQLAKNHFGNQADNMTGIVCLIQSPTGQ